jgi:hypothetical protein
MSADRDHERAQELLAEMAEREAQVMRRVQDRLMATDDDERIDRLGRTFQRVNRSLRQTLALKAKLAREREDHVVRHAPLGVRPGRPQRFDPKAAEGRVAQLKDAVTRVAAAEPPDWLDGEKLDLEELAGDLETAVFDLMNDDEDFLERPLDEQVAILCEVFELPPDLAARWRDLPPAAAAAPPDPPPASSA